MNRKGLSPIIASIILIAVTIVVSIAVASWMGALISPMFDLKKKGNNDIYHPDNSTLNIAYENCIEALEKENYTVYDAQFSKNIWMETGNFTNFLNRLQEYDITAIFADSPKARGDFLGIKLAPFEAYIWVNIPLPNGETLTIYHQLVRS